jgi:LCP family protein required for cell wall assembly
MRKKEIVHSTNRGSIVEALGDNPLPGRKKFKVNISAKPKVKALQSKSEGSTGMRWLNRLAFLAILVIICLNGFYIYNYKVDKQSIKQAFSGVAGRSLEIVDALWEPKLKNTDGYTGILVMGIDSRELKFDGKSFTGKDRDIDSIIQVVVNNSTGDVFMFSLPRDIGVTITEPCARQSLQYFKSINHGYKLGEDGKCPEGGVGIMTKYITSVTGFDSHYYAIISYDSFREIINAVGDEQNGKQGLFIDVPRNIQEYYPREQGGGFEAVYFRKGYQFIDSVQLLKYARSRKASSDFDRANRQQQVLEALQKKLLSSQTLQDPGKLLELYQAFGSKALFSPIDIEDIRGGLDLVSKLAKASSEGRMYKFVLDDQFGGLNSLLTRPIYSGKGTHNRPGYYLSPVAYKDPVCVARKDEYCRLKDYLKQIYADPSSVAESAQIFVYSNVNNTTPQSDKLASGLSALAMPTTTSRYALPMRDGWGEIQIYDFTNNGKPKTRARLAQAFGAANIRDGSLAPFKPLNNDDFAIVVKMN